MKTKVNDNKFTLTRLLIVLFVAAYVLRTFTKINYVYTNIIIIAIGLIAYIRIYFSDKEVRQKSKFIICFAIISLIPMFVTHNVSLGEILLIVSYQGIAFTLLKDKVSIKYFHWCLFGIYFILFITYIKEHNFNEVLNMASSNFISVILIMLLIMSGLYLLSENRKPSIIIMLIGVVFCFLSGGRGGILTILLFFVGIFYLNYMRSKSIVKKVLFIFMVIIGFTSGYFLYYDKITYYLGLVTYDAPRFYIWQLYISSTLSSIKNVIFGTPFETHQIFINFLKNLHNLFLNVHAKYGLIPLVMIIYANCKCIIQFIKVKNYYNLLFLFVLLLRSFTDYANFAGIFDIAWFYLYYECLSYKTDKQSSLN